MGIRRLVLLPLAGLLVWGLTYITVLASQLFLPEGNMNAEPADAIVCLGAGMSRHGWTLPDDRSLRRAQTCAALQQAGAAPVVVFTGYGHDVYSAAAAMADAARAAGTPDAAIVLEEQAQSTLQNAGFTRNLLPEDARSVIVVSDAYHLPRAWVIFHVMGFSDVRLHRVPAEPDVLAPGLRIIFRESIAVWYNAARIAAYWGGGLVGIDEATRLSWFN